VLSTAAVTLLVEVAVSKMGFRFTVVKLKVDL
jgi:hypothetical protein